MGGRDGGASGGKLITVRSASGDPEQCIIDCRGSGQGFHFHSGENDLAGNNGGIVSVTDLLKMLGHYDPAGVGCP